MYMNFMLLKLIFMRYNFVILVRVNRRMVFMKIDIELNLNDNVYFRMWRPLQ